MKLRMLVVVGAIAAAMVPLGAHADHCDSPIYVFSRTRVQTDVDDPANPGQKIGRNAPSAVSSAVGCTVAEEGGEDVPDEAHPATDTDVIYPGANRLEVRLLDHGNDPSIIESATLTFAGDTYELAFQPGVSVTGEAANWLDSQTITIDPADTVVRNQAVAKICLVDEEIGCYTRTYRTV